jgi:hypothetical protein
MMEFFAALENSGFSAWLRESGSIWAYPTVLTLHTVGLALLVGGNIALDLRVLGVAPNVEVSALDRLFPVMWWGFAINAVSGVMLFAADATSKGVLKIFFLKLACVAGGVVVMVAMRRALAVPSAGAAAGTGVRRLAVLSLVLWATAITAGRFMAYV